MKIILDENCAISTDLFVKPTDIHQFLASDPCHPGHIKRSVAFSQALRILRICSSLDVALEICSELAGFLIRRGHSKSNVNQQIRSAIDKSTRNNSEPDHSASTNEKHIVPLVLQHYPGLPDINQILTNFK